MLNRIPASIRLYGLVLLAVMAVYFGSASVTAVFFIATLIAYFFAKDEAFWLVFFLILSDGFLSFFGLYEATLVVLPGLPGIEMGQLYIILAVIKSLGKKPATHAFYNNFLYALGLYVVFLIVQGYVVGLSGAMNVQFRLLKWITPLGLFYAMPRLYRSEQDYARIFRYIFPMAFVILGTQLFTILMSETPAQFSGGKEKYEFAIEVTKEKTYRGLFNQMVLLLTLFGALFYLARQRGIFRNMYLYAVIAANFASVFLSATRGWTIGFSVIIICFFLFVQKLGTRQLVSIIGVGALFFIGVLSTPVIQTQVNNAFKRMLTLEALAKGDLTANGTLIRLSQRGPRVMKQWKESPITGWGFSNHFFEHGDFHVGNQNILLHSGVIGYILINSFFIFFCLSLYNKSQETPHFDTRKEGLLVFVVFFAGWFLIHSTSEQHFFFYFENPGNGIIQGVFFTMAALIFSREEVSIEKSQPSLAVPEIA